MYKCRQKYSVSEMQGHLYSPSDLHICVRCGPHLTLRRPWENISEVGVEAVMERLHTNFYQTALHNAGLQNGHFVYE